MANHVAFTSGCKRFGRITVHPRLDPAGLYSERPDACDPGLYNPIHIQNYCAAIHSQGLRKDPWRYKRELEEWSVNLGYRNQKILARRRWDRSLLGPAWHEIPDPVKYQPACPNVMFGRTSRTIRSRSFTPGPGTYYKLKPFKAPFGPHSTLQTLDREEPCRFKDMAPPWSLAPDRYWICDKESIAEKSNKIVSLRGPYDLFTGRRDGTVKNHFNTSLKCSATTWPLSLSGYMESLNKTRLGVMNKTGFDKPHRGRNTLVDQNMCIRCPRDPGPASYSVRKPIEFKKYKYGFNSSYDKAPGYMRVVVWPGVGRYKIANLYDIPGHGHSHVFLCKIGRTVGAYIQEPMNSF